MAHHTAEKLSRYNILTVVAVAVGFSLGIGDSIVRAAVQLAFELPNGRAQESEADYIGLMMMSQSCYDPQGAISFWGRMVKAEKGAPPEFMSTHPSSSHRVARLTEWLPEAEQKRNQSGCGGILDYGKFLLRSGPPFQCPVDDGQDRSESSRDPCRWSSGYLEIKDYQKFTDVDLEGRDSCRASFANHHPLLKEHRSNEVSREKANQDQPKTSEERSLRHGGKGDCSLSNATVRVVNVSTRILSARALWLPADLNSTPPASERFSPYPHFGKNPTQR